MVDTKKDTDIKSNYTINVWTWDIDIKNTGTKNAWIRAINIKKTCIKVWAYIKIIYIKDAWIKSVFILDIYVKNTSIKDIYAKNVFFCLKCLYQRYLNQNC